MLSPKELRSVRNNGLVKLSREGQRKHYPLSIVNLTMNLKKLLTSAHPPIKSGFDYHAWPVSLLAAGSANPFLLGQSGVRKDTVCLVLYFQRKKEDKFRQFLYLLDNDHMRHQRQ